MTSDDPILSRLTRIVAATSGTVSSDFDLNPPEMRPPPERLVPAAVLVPFVKRADGWRVVLTKRTADLKHHPGQVAFPGGKCDPGDPSRAATALREAEEEIGLNPSGVSVIGSIGAHHTVTGFDVTPVVATIDPGFSPIPEPGEVEQVFEVPFRFLMNPAHTRIEGRHWRGHFRRYFVMPYGPYYIWGATARMIVGLRRAWDGVS